MFLAPELQALLFRFGTLKNKDLFRGGLGRGVQPPKFFGLLEKQVFM